MSDLFLLSPAQMSRLSPHFPLAHGVPRVDDRRVVSGIVYIIRNGLQWKDAPKAYGPHKTLYNRFVRWSRLGVFDRIFVALSQGGPRPEPIMIDATRLKAHRTAASLLKRGCSPPYRTHQRRAELQVTRCVRSGGPTDHPLAQRRSRSATTGAPPWC